MFTMDPIGYFHTSQREKYSVPSQGSMALENEGVIKLKSHQQFEQALEGLDGFDRIWVVFLFHRNTHWKPKVLPPRGGKKRGVFATRSPHRPNFIGLSCVELKAIQGLNLFIAQHDLLDGTPILDIKPYLTYADSFSSCRQGWLETIEPFSDFEVTWTEKAQEQIDYLNQKGVVDMKQIVEQRLKTNPFPYPNHRIKKLDAITYELAYKSWRILYEIDNQDIAILRIKSGYDLLTLEGKKPSKWGDLALHLEFQQVFRLV